MTDTCDDMMCCMYSAIKFSVSDGSMMASIDNGGRATIWQLSARLSKEQEGERIAIDHMGNAT